MLFTCPGAAARGGQQRATKGARRHVCIDVHCHVHYPPADEMVKHAFAPEREPALRFSNELSRSTNMRGMGYPLEAPSHSSCQIATAPSR
jgi:hypothetical protein